MSTDHGPEVAHKPGVWYPWCLCIMGWKWPRWAKVWHTALNTDTHKIIFCWHICVVQMCVNCGPERAHRPGVWDACSENTPESLKKRSNILQTDKRNKYFCHKTNKIHKNIVSFSEYFWHVLWKKIKCRSTHWFLPPVLWCVACTVQPAT